MVSPQQASRVASSDAVCPLCGSEDSYRWLSSNDKFHQRPRRFDLRRCAACSVVWLENAPPIEEMDTHYGADYHRVITRSAEGFTSRWEGHYKTLVKHQPSGDVLDIGCSSGSFLEALKGRPWKGFGIELSPEAAERARQRTGADVFAGDLFDAPFAPNSFDAVTSFDVLEHLHRPREAMRKVWEWLRPGGVFYVWVPNALCWEARFFGPYWYGLELPRHLFHFSPTALRRLMTSIGFAEERLITPPVEHVEHSMRYVADEVYRKVGVKRLPMSVAPLPSVPFKVVRKAFRLTALSLYRHAASAAGAGPAIEAVFRKPAQS